MGYVKVKDNANLVRDEYSGAIINTNVSEYKNAKAAVERQQRVDRLEESVSSMNEDIKLIKDLLLRLEKER